MKEELERKLFEEFPNLYRRDKPPTESLMCFGFEVGDGWFDLLYELSREVQHLVESDERYKNLEVQQVKSKFAGLRYYTSFVTPELNKLINEAYGYRNDELPKARGEAARLIADAEAYRDEIIQYAEGDTSRFLQNYEEYKNAKEITRKRLYIETMEKILPNVQKYVLEKSGEGLIEVLPLGKDILGRLGEKK